MNKIKTREKINNTEINKNSSNNNRINIFQYIDIVEEKKQMQQPK
jgi:hypothetical protein